MIKSIVLLQNTFFNMTTSVIPYIKWQYIKYFVTRLGLAAQQLQEDFGKIVVQPIMVDHECLHLQPCKPHQPPILFTELTIAILHLPITQ